MRKTKRIAMALFMMVCSIAMFAQTASPEIVVQSVVGKVEYEVSAGKWAPVKADMKLSPSTMITTGLNSGLVLKMGDKIITIKATRKGTVEKLVAAATPVTGGVQLGAKAASSNVATDPTQKRTGISTASTRAENAAEDDTLPFQTE